MGTVTHAVFGSERWWKELTDETNRMVDIFCAGLADSARVEIAAAIVAMARGAAAKYPVKARPEVKVPESVALSEVDRETLNEELRNAAQSAAQAEWDTMFLVSCRAIFSALPRILALASSQPVVP